MIGKKTRYVKEMYVYNTLIKTLLYKFDELVYNTTFYICFIYVCILLICILAQGRDGEPLEPYIRGTPWIQVLNQNIIVVKLHTKHEFRLDEFV